MTTTAAASIVTISYQDLTSFDPSDPDESLVSKIGKAFGSDKDCLGILAVSDIPDFHAQRQALLPLAARLPHLSDLEDCTLPHALYSTGWSHGKEELAPGKPDFAKGSYYSNPRVDSLVDTLIARGEDSSDFWKQQAKIHPEFYADNVWPKSLPELREAFMTMGQTIVKVGGLLAAVCDVYCQQQGVETSLAELLTKSMNTKGRLLHYFDVTEQQNDADMWCGWHNDHGSLTGLVPAMYLDANGNAVNCTDDKAGLYIQTRSGEIVKAKLPTDACGFQIGETSQIQSGGCLQATPHAVRPATQPGITRETFAVFLEPEFHTPLEIPPTKTVQDCQAADVKLPSSIVPVKDRWKPGQTFGDFHQATVSCFTTTG